MEKSIALALAAIFTGVSSLPAQRALPTQMGLDWSRERPAINVQVLGQVKNPGIHKLEAFDRLSHAIGAAGGPNDQASIRSVVLMRGGKPIDTLDLYRYLAENVQEENPELRDGDVVFFPVAENMVTVVGQVFKPGRYEIKPGERLRNVITMAGGFTPITTRESIKIQNIATPDSVVSIDFRKLTVEQDKASNVMLREGDIVTVPTTPTTVTVVGQVQKGGTFPYEPGTLLSYYIGLAGGYGERASTGNIRINRWGGKRVGAREDSVIEPGDVVVVGEMQIKGWRDYIEVSGQLLTMFFIVWSITK